MPGLFITGTDTGVGKTYIAAAIARSLCAEGRNVGVLKPVATGATRDKTGWQIEDAQILIAATGSTCSVAEVCPIAFEEPLAPPVAARRAGQVLTFDYIEKQTFEALSHWRDRRRADVMVVEGVGGFLCPLAEEATVADLAVRLDFPVLIVARRGLGTLNHTLLTVEAVLSRALRVAGVILNSAEESRDPLAEATNPDELGRRLGSIPILEIVTYTQSRALSPFDSRGGDWYTRLKRPRLFTSLA